MFFVGNFPDALPECSSQAIRELQANYAHFIDGKALVESKTPPGSSEFYIESSAGSARRQVSTRRLGVGKDSESHAEHRRRKGQCLVWTLPRFA
jgi:hypothetical protein